MRSFDAYLYNPFSSEAFGGNVCWVIPHSNDLNESDMGKIAAELAAPATAFIFQAKSNSPQIRFFSPSGEFSMCGHAIVAGMCALAELDIVSTDQNKIANLNLQAPPGEIPIEISWDENDQPHCIMTQPNPWFKPTDVSIETAAKLLGLPVAAMNTDLPIQTGSTGLKHVFLPVRSVNDMEAIHPDIDGLHALSNRLNVDSVAVFSMDRENSEIDVRIRDFCPAIGVPEEAASGTTNGAVGSYLVTHKKIPVSSNGISLITAHQGVEMKRQSIIQTQIGVTEDVITSVKVSGTATRILSGKLCIP